MQEDIGYIRAQVETLKDEHASMKDFLKEMRKEIQDTIWNDRMEFRRVMTEHIKTEEERLKKIEEHVSLTRNLIMFAKALGYTVVFVLAFKFGDIPGLWKELFK